MTLPYAPALRHVQEHLQDAHLALEAGNGRPSESSIQCSRDNMRAALLHAQPILQEHPSYELTLVLADLLQAQEALLPGRVDVLACRSHQRHAALRLLREIDAAEKAAA